MSELTDEEFDAITSSLPSFNWGPMAGGAWSPMTEGFWRAAGRGEFTVPKCRTCGIHRWPPVENCYSCHSMEWDWDAVPGRGRVYTYMWADHPVFPDHGVYNMAVIELAATVGEPVRVLSRVLDVAKEELACELPVVVAFEDVGGGLAIPFWRLASSA
jgi:uncharacterized OB-fold protein